MKIRHAVLNKFRDEAAESLDIPDLTGKLFQCIRDTCEGMDTFNAGFFVPNRFDQEWNAFATMTSDLIYSGEEINNERSAMLFNKLSFLAEFFSGYPGTIYEYSDLGSLQKVFAHDNLPLFIEGYHVVIYAASAYNEALVCGIFLRRGNRFTPNEKQSLADLLDTYCKQVGKNVRVHNRMAQYLND